MLRKLLAIALLAFVGASSAQTMLSPPGPYGTSGNPIRGTSGTNYSALNSCFSVTVLSGDVAGLEAAGWTAFTGGGCATQPPPGAPQGIFSPSSITYGAVLNAANAAYAAGGGIVQLQAGTYLLGGNTLPMLQNVTYNGVGWSQSLWQSGTQPNGGTVIVGNGTADCFAAKTTPLGSWDAAWVFNANITNLAMWNCRNGINIGAANSAGRANSTFRNLYIGDMTGWGIIDENMQNTLTELITLEGNANGMAFCTSQTSNNTGDSIIDYIDYTGVAADQTTQTSRNILFCARNGATQLNGVQIRRVGGINNAASIFTFTGTMTNGSANITAVTATTGQLAIGLPVVVTSSSPPAPFNHNTTYFVQSISGSSGNYTITLSPLDYTDYTTGVNGTTGNAAISVTGSTTTGVTFGSGGFAGVEVAGMSQNAAVANMDMQATNMEGAATCNYVFQNVAAAQYYGASSPAANQSNWGTANYYGMCLRSVGTNFTITGGPGFLIDSDELYMSNVEFTSGDETGKQFGKVGMSIVGGSSNQACAYLGGNPTGDLCFNGSNGWLTANRGIQLPATATGATSSPGLYNAGVVTLVAGSGTVTIPNPGSANAGMVFYLSNPTASTETVTTAGGSALIYGGGNAGATSVTLPAYTTWVMSSTYDNTTYRWAYKHRWDERAANDFIWGNQAANDGIFSLAQGL
jgi:hypothetical protein